MGGIAFIMAIAIVLLVIATVYAIMGNQKELIPLALTMALAVMNGMIGFFDDYKKFFSISFPEAALNTAEKYQKYGLVRISDKGISLTKSGFLVSNSIIADILNYI